MKIFSRLEIFSFAGIEICADLKRATMWNNGGTEAVEQNNRYEPWVAFYRPLAKTNWWWVLHYGNEMRI